MLNGAATVAEMLAALGCSDVKVRSTRCLS
jgi:hypothetical protein